MRPSKSVCLLFAMGVGVLGFGRTRVSAKSSETQPAADTPSTLHIGSGEIDINLISKPTALSDQDLKFWIQTAGRAVSTYYGHFPVKRVLLQIQVGAEDQEIHGRTFNGERMNVDFGPGVTVADLNDDWILTHEMFHLGSPDLGDDHLWLSEGLSTYLEPISRAAIGTLTPERIWHDMIEGMPQGQPEAGDEGLDRTHTWGRTYWGGCLYCLLADIQIRERTAGRRSLQDALRAILDAGGDGSADWPMSRMLDTGDQATGTTVLNDLYKEMALKPKTVDLEGLWKSLGIHRRNESVKFDNAAPLAAVRRAITTESPSK